MNAASRAGETRAAVARLDSGFLCSCKSPNFQANHIFVHLLTSLLKCLKAAQEDAEKLS
jgi:hypothetical protein